jgi:hypothetical protein
MRNAITSPLVYPGGIAPAGVDYTHIAANGVISSVVAKNTGFVNLLRGTAATMSGGGPVFSMVGKIGPSGNTATNVNANVPGSTSAFTSVTMAAIVTYDSLPGAAAYIVNHIANGFGAGILLASGTGVFQMVTGTTGSPITSALGLTIGGSYFLAASFNTATINFIAVRLDNGQIFKATVSNTDTATAGDGTVYIGNRGLNARSFPGRIAAAMSSSSYMSAQALDVWAKDPWAFWYPQPVGI